MPERERARRDRTGPAPGDRDKRKGDRQRATQKRRKIHTALGGGGKAFQILSGQPPAHVFKEKNKQRKIVVGQILTRKSRIDSLRELVPRSPRAKKRGESIAETGG